VREHTAVDVGQFSDDGQWWWDGQAWVATSQIVIPDLPATERTKELETRVKPHRLLDKANLYAYFVPFDGWSLNSTLVWPWLFTYRRAFRAYREWTLEQFKSATTYLLGPDEPVLAAEVGLYAEILIGQVWGGHAVVVTDQHVLILANDKALGRPRRVLLAAHPRQVGMREHAGGILNAYPTILVSARAQVWPIKGMNGIIQPGPLIAAWWRVATAVRT
jgi:hypothetical protein